MKPLYPPDAKAEQVINRLGKNFPVCPDCGKVLDKIRVETSHYVVKRLNHVTTELDDIKEDDEDFGDDGGARCYVDDPRYRCYYCDSLNVDSVVCDWTNGIRHGK